MGWRTVWITTNCKLSVQENHMLIKTISDTKKIHLSEIDTIIVDNLESAITTHLLFELVKNKIKIIFTDNKKQPCSEVVPYYNMRSTSKKVAIQAKWDEDIKQVAWKLIVEEKIKNQAYCLKKYNFAEYKELENLATTVKINDESNNEGHAAKRYFHTLFTTKFTRELDCDINSALDYGYHIILSQVSKAIVQSGYITQLGIFHRNEFNHFNLACDLMEPFRIFCDMIVYENREKNFDKSYKQKLINILNKKVKIDGIENYLPKAIDIFVKSVFNFLEGNDTIRFPEVSSFEL